MSDHELNQIAETVDAIVDRAGPAAREGSLLLPLLAEAGMRRVAVPASAGGSEGEPGYLAVVLNRLGYHAVHSGLLEDHAAAELLAEHGLDVPEGMLTVATDCDLVVDEAAGTPTVTGLCRHVPWARTATHVLAAVGSSGSGLIALVPLCDATITTRQNIAGEPRDDISFDGVGAVALVAGSSALHALRARMLVYRSLMMLGAGERALDLTVTHVTDRSQFGSALSRKQAVQHYAADMFSALAAARSANEAALLALRGANDVSALAAALATRIEADRMASIVARLAHQLHGAVGFTQEHTLHFSTKLLMAWRQDDLPETAAAIELARLVPAFGSPWATLTAG